MYKFHKIDCNQLEYSKRLFTDCELYFANPKEYNDPWESSPLLYNKKLTDKDNQEIQDNYHQWLENYRICCFSEIPECPLMWSHYSDSHRGFCLEFDASEKSTFGSAMKVIYQDKRPIIDCSKQNENENLCASILTKAEFWKYEQEYRLIGGNDKQPGALSLDNGIFRFSEAFLTGIIFGCKMPSSNIDLVKHWTLLSKNKFTNLTYKKAEMNKKNFSLDIVSLQIKTIITYFVINLITLEQTPKTTTKVLSYAGSGNTIDESAFNEQSIMKIMDNDTNMLEEYDFSDGIKGKYAKRYDTGTNVFVIEPDVSQYFPDHDSVNEALRSLISIVKKQAQRNTENAE